MHELDTNIEAASLLSPKSKLRWGSVLVLVALVAIINGTSELIWPFINQMILDFGIAPDKKSVGFYSGLIETVASFFSFATIMPGSFAADRWGRKAVLCSSLVGTAIGLAFFGVSSTLPALIVCRSIGYALGPQLQWSTTVTMLGDVADASNQGIAFSAVNASYRIGQFFSPCFAMLLAHPSLRYKWFQSEFWVAYPYALPCWAGATLCTAAVYVAMYCLPETAPGLCDSIDDVQEGNDYGATISKGPASSQIEDEPAPSQIIPITITLSAGTAIDQPPSTLFSPHILHLLLSSWIMYFMTMSFFALFPLWAFTPVSDGGLGASEITIGTYISARAIIQFLALGPFAHLETRLGMYQLYAYSLTMFTLVCSVSFPAINLLAKLYGAQSPCTSIAVFLFFIAGGFGNYCTTCMVMMMNRATPSAQALSRLVGISQTFLALGQCMAPIVTLSLFQFSIKSDILGGNLVWVFLTGMGLLASFHAFTLDPPKADE